MERRDFVGRVARLGVAKNIVGRGLGSASGSASTITDGCESSDAESRACDGAVAWLARSSTAAGATVAGSSPAPPSVDGVASSGTQQRVGSPQAMRCAPGQPRSDQSDARGSRAARKSPALLVALEKLAPMCASSYPNKIAQGKQQRAARDDEIKPCCSSCSSTLSTRPSTPHNWRNVSEATAPLETPCSSRAASSSRGLYGEATSPSHNRRQSLWRIKHEGATRRLLGRDQGDGRRHKLPSIKLESNAVEAQSAWEAVNARPPGASVVVQVDGGTPQLTSSPAKIAQKRRNASLK